MPTLIPRSALMRCDREADLAPGLHSKLPECDCQVHLARSQGPSTINVLMTIADGERGERQNLLPECAGGEGGGPSSPCARVSQSNVLIDNELMVMSLCATTCYMVQRCDIVGGRMSLTIAGTEYLTADEVCRLVGVSRQTLWRWRQNARIPPGSRLRAKRLVFSLPEVEQIQTYASFLEPADRRSGVQLRLFATDTNGMK